MTARPPMSIDVRVARMALDIIRTSALGGTCKHPAEALTHTEVRCEFSCGMCNVTVTEEVVAYVAANPLAGRVTTRPGPLDWAFLS